MPNFITEKKIVASILQLHPDNLSEQDLNLENSIVLIEGADPGFDWIFSFNIGGLITRYGGANSHMAIRCAEFNIPAAIGCGDHYFHKLTQTSVAGLDCGAKKIEFIS